MIPSLRGRQKKKKERGRGNLTASKSARGTRGGETREPLSSHPLETLASLHTQISPSPSYFNACYTGSINPVKPNKRKRKGQMKTQLLKCNVYETR